MPRDIDIRRLVKLKPLRWFDSAGNLITAASDNLRPIDKERREWIASLEAVDG